MLSAALKQKLDARREFLSRIRLAAAEDRSAARNAAWLNLSRSVMSELISELGRDEAFDLVNAVMPAEPPDGWDSNSVEFWFKVRAGVGRYCLDSLAECKFVWDGHAWHRAEILCGNQCRLPGHAKHGRFLWRAVSPEAAIRRCRDLVTALVWAQGDMADLEASEPPPF